MSRSLGSSLPADLYGRLIPETPRDGHEAVLVLSTDSEGWPHVAMLSLYEIVAPQRDQMLLAIHQSSKTCSNLRARARLTVAIIDDKMTYYVKAGAEQVGGKPENDEGKGFPMTVFRAKVREVLEDSIPGAKITSGLTFSESQHAERHELVFEKLRVMVPSRVS